MSEKREFPILNGKLLSDLDLNGHKLLGLDIPEGGGGGGGGGGGSSVEIVAPSDEGAGKAADAKAVYEALEGKRGLDNLDYVRTENPLVAADSTFTISVAGAVVDTLTRDSDIVWTGKTYRIEVKDVSTRLCTVCRIVNQLFGQVEFTFNDNYDATVFLSHSNETIEIRGIGEIKDKIALISEVETKVGDLDNQLTAKRDRIDNIFYVKGTPGVTPPYGAFKVSGNGVVIDTLYRGDGKNAWTGKGLVFIIPKSGVGITAGFSVYESQDTGVASLLVDFDGTFVQTTLLDGTEIEIEGYAATEVALKSDIPAAPDLSDYAKTAEVLPRYKIGVSIEYSDGDDLYLTPFSQQRLRGDYELVSVDVNYIEGDYLRDCVFVIDCEGLETAPRIQWGFDGGNTFRPRTDAETDMACVAGKRNVYWISEFAINAFVVAGWQVPDAGGGE